MTFDDDTRLSEAEAAAKVLGLDSPLRLARWRTQGRAPPHEINASGDVFYDRDALIEWREHFVYPPGDVNQDNGRES